MINLKISTCLTIAITLILCVWGFSYKGTYTDITGEPDYLDSMLVAEIPTDIAIDECNILSNSLSQVSYILRIIPSEATEQLFGIAQQKVIVQEVYAGTDIQPGDEIYITSNHWSIYLDGGERTIGRGFVNVLDIGKEYLVFCTGTVTMPDLSIPVYRLYDQSRICPVFCYEDILNASGKQEWSLSVIRSILTNEKYYGDVLQQKTFTQDCISKKKVRNTGQLPMYLVTNNHQGIIDRQTFDAVQVEMARRGACKSPSRKNAPTGLSAYKSRYALSERLVCGECGTLYRRCTWSKRGKKKVVWRCVSRLDYGTKYCHKSPTLEEGSLQRTILAAISSVMSQKETIISRITGAMEQTLAPIPGETMSLSEIEQRLAEIDEEVRRIVVQTAEQGLNICSDHMKALTDECAELKKQRSRIQEQRTNNSALMKRVDDVASTLRQTSPTITEWDESIIRQLVDTVKVVSSEKIIVYLQGGTQVEQNMVE